MEFYRIRMLTYNSSSYCHSVIHQTAPFRGTHLTESIRIMLLGLGSLSFICHQFVSNLWPSAHIQGIVLGNLIRGMSYRIQVASFTRVGMGNKTAPRLDTWLIVWQMVEEWSEFDWLVRWELVNVNGSLHAHRNRKYGKWVGWLVGHAETWWMVCGWTGWSES